MNVFKQAEKVLDTVLVVALMPDILKAITHELVFIPPCFFVWIPRDDVK